MASSLMNTQECKDSTETLYDPYDVFCKYAETTSNKGELNAYNTSCEAKLAMEEVPTECLKCKGLYKGPKRELTEEQRLTKNASTRAYTKRLRGEGKEWTCVTCGVSVGKRFKYCTEHKVIAERERIIREREKKRAKALKLNCLD